MHLRKWELRPSAAPGVPSWPPRRPPKVGEGERERERIVIIIIIIFLFKIRIRELDGGFPLVSLTNWLCKW